MTSQVKYGLLAVVTLLCSGIERARAGAQPVELAPTVPWYSDFRPGKLDFIISHDPSQQFVDTFFWSPVAKFGGGTLDFKNGLDQTFVGGYFRPLWAVPNYGDLVIGGMHVESQAGRQYEFQLEYTLPCHLGFGGGFVQNELTPGDDYHFLKAEYGGQFAGWNYKLSAVALDTLQHWTGGAYLALYNQYFMASAGTDGEEFRATLGVIGPKRKDSPIRLAMEAIYSDSDVGQFYPAGQSLLISGTLGFEGGFLSNEVRLGRAMGPTGVEMTNPLGFLRPTWNRRLEVWELGTLLNWRVELSLRDYRTAQDAYELVAFPARPFTDNLLSGFFVGGSCRRFSDDDANWGLLAGFAGQVAPHAKINVGFAQFFTSDELRVTVGVILPY
jgi:hypothetical protein